MISAGALLQRWRPTRTTGCDCGGATFKFVQLDPAGDGYRLEAQGLLEVDWQGDEEAAIARVREFLRERQLHLGKVNLNLSDPALFIRRMELAKMPERDLQLAIRWNLRDMVEGPLEQLLVAYSEIAKVGADERRLLLTYGVNDKVVHARKERGSKLGLKVSGIEPNVSALAAAFAYNVECEPGRCYALVDVGYNYGNFLVMIDGKPVYTRHLGDIQLAKLAVSLTSTAAQVEERWAALHKFDEGMTGFGERESNLLREFYSRWVVEVQRSIDSYAADSTEPIQEGQWRLYLCGCGSLMPNITEVTAKNIGIETVLFDPFARIVDRSGEPAQVARPGLFAVAVGLAIPQQ